MGRIVPHQRLWFHAIVPMILLTGTSTGRAENAESVQKPRFTLEFAPFAEDPPTYSPVEGAVDITSLEIPFETVGQQLGSGTASYYGRRFHGRRTASGEKFDMHALTAAHRTLPFGSLVRVTNPRNGLSVVVRINDRGPFARGRMIDLSRAAAEQIGLTRRGHGKVELALLE